MPFTLDGQWISSKIPKDKKPITVSLVKRGNKEVTIISNLEGVGIDLNLLLSTIKKKIGCGGTLKEDQLEIQGHKIVEVKKILQFMKIDCK